jgi:hypothetical protein
MNPTNTRSEDQEPGVAHPAPPLVKPRKPVSSGLLLAHALAAGGNRLILPTPAPTRERTPEEQELAEAISRDNLCAAEAKRLRRQQRNLKKR